MIVNPEIKKLFADIAEQSNKYLNQRDDKKKYVKRLVKIYKDNLSEEEQVYLANQLLEQLSYKSIVVDPENLIALNNVKHRTYFVILTFTLIAMVIAAALFETSPAVNGVVSAIKKVLILITF